MIQNNRTRQSTLVSVCASLLAWNSQIAKGQPGASALELQYEAPSECPTRSAVEGAALRLAGQVPPKPIVASVYIERDDKIYRAHVRTRGVAHQRILEDASCASVAEAIEVLLALAIDPDAHIGGVSTSSTPAPDAATGSTPAPVAGSNSQPRLVSNADLPESAAPHTYPQVSADGTKQERMLVISALLGIEGGALPHVAEIGGAGVAVPISDRWRLTENGSLWRHSSQAVAGSSAGGVFSLWTLASGACVTATRTLPMTSLCMALEAGRLSGASYGVRSNGAGGSLWLTPLVGFEVGVPASSWVALVVDAQLGVPLVRRAFYLQDLGTAQSSELHRPSALSARLGFGLSLNL